MTTAPPPITPKPAQSSKFAITSGPVKAAYRIGLYGVGGVGKTELAALAPKPIIIDLERGSNALGVDRITGIETFPQLLECLRDPALLAYRTVWLDSVTVAQDMAVAHLLATIPGEKGVTAKNLESYGYGKGYAYLYDQMQMLWAAADRIVAAGSNVGFICHTVASKAVNPEGENYLQHQPALTSSESNTRANVRTRFQAGLDYLLFINYDRMVDDEGKAKSSGTRSIFTQERGGYWAKARTPVNGQPLPPSIPYTKGSAKVWELIGLQ